MYKLIHWYHAHWQVIQEISPNYFFSFFGRINALQHGAGIQIKLGVLVENFFFWLPKKKFCGYRKNISCTSMHKNKNMF